MQAGHLKEITTWISSGARNGVSPEEMMQELCERLVAAGFELGRVGVFVRTLHPQMFGQSFTWRPDVGVTIYAAPYGIEDSAEFLNSPLSIVHTRDEEVRRREAEILTDTVSSFFVDARARR